MVLGVLDEATDIVPGSGVGQDEALAAAVQQAGHRLVFEVGDTHDRRNACGVGVGDHIHNRLQIERGVLATDEHKLHARLGQRIDRSPSPEFQQRRPQDHAAGCELFLELIVTHGHRIFLLCLPHTRILGQNKSRQRTAGNVSVFCFLLTGAAASGSSGTACQAYR